LFSDDASVRRVPPHFSVPPEGVEVMPGGSVNLTCVAIGSPVPEVRWRLGAVPLTPEESTPVGKNVLMLRDVKESATYTCVAASELGSSEYDAEVRVKGQHLMLMVTCVRVIRQNCTRGPPFTSFIFLFYRTDVDRYIRL
jgi:hypothetical protein